MPYMMFFLGTLMLLMGLEELQKGKKRFWYMSIVVSLFIFVVSIQTLLVN
ncbi:DUF3953 domain-containing protein [Paenibacillus sp. BAC0078]